MEPNFVDLVSMINLYTIIYILLNDWLIFPSVWDLIPKSF